ncbi:MAG: InlB B-repeat-containing protein [Clostridia bacterium]|nr:InlB B-repeat-containing protein [Clostridia bacterium]
MPIADPELARLLLDVWYDAEEGGNKVTAISNTQTGNITLYARWSVPTYTVTYNLDGGVNNAANEATYTFGVGLTLADPTRTGYTFDGWYDAQEGGNKVTAISATQAGDVTLYARWTKDTTTNTSTNTDTSTNSGCNSSIGGTVSLLGGLLLLSAGTIVIFKCKKKN